jgi:LuxR family maltose regulon positive regulatory protein
MSDRPGEFEDLGADDDEFPAIVRGQWVEAEMLAEQARSIVRRGRLEEYVTSVLLYAIAARSAIHRGELARARENLGRAHRLRGRVTAALPVYAAQTRLEQVRAHIALTDLPAAGTLLAEVDVLLRERPDLDLLRREAGELRTQFEAMQHGDAELNGSSSGLGDALPPGAPSP